MNRIDLRALTLAGPTGTNPVLDPLAVLRCTTMILLKILNLILLICCALKYNFNSFNMFLCSADSPENAQPFTGRDNFTQRAEVRAAVAGPVGRALNVRYLPRVNVQTDVTQI